MFFNILCSPVSEAVFHMMMMKLKCGLIEKDMNLILFCFPQLMLMAVLNCLFDSLSQMLR